jgi:hypothetical protein
MVSGREAFDKVIAIGMVDRALTIVSEGGYF